MEHDQEAKEALINKDIIERGYIQLFFCRYIQQQTIWVKFQKFINEGILKLFILKLLQVN